ncbi:MAG: NAD(P)-binding protein [Desulfobulbaceae bacterium]|nr:NAD(P)-binding protein [Desulfobulbaceae bacterium]
MSHKPIDSNPILDSALNWQYPEFAEEHGTEKVVAFGDHSHKCPIYVRKIPPCTAGCPAGNDIRAWLTIVQQSKLKNRNWEESYELAWHEASKTTPFPASCGRVCPYPCESHCNRTKKNDGAVNIAAFERWLGDYGIRHGLRHKKLRHEVMDKKVAIIGAGPAGLSCAFQLARRGYPVTVFEAFAKPGGMLRYGIPAFRLPHNILDAEIDAIAQMGVEIVCNTIIGKDKDLEELKANFDAIFVGIGAHKGIELESEVRDAVNVLSGVTFLNQVNSGRQVEVGNNVVVIGGGNTAITAARVARRLGAQVTILYRRTRAEMPTLDKEINDALTENIDIRYLVAPIGIRSENGKALAIKCQKMELGELDASGRRQAVPIAESDFEIPCTALISAISQRPDWSGLQLNTTKNGWLKPDDNWAVDKGIYAGGDVISLALVTTAIGHGRKAAERIDAQLKGERFQSHDDWQLATPETLRLEYYAERERNEREWVPEEKRCSGGLGLEADLGLTEEKFRAESKRCMSCGLCFECRQCLIFCPQTAIVEFPQNPSGEVMYTNYTKCVGCHICFQACPCGYIQMGMSDEL